MLLSRKDFIKTSSLGALSLLLTGKMAFAQAQELPLKALKGSLFTFSKSGGTILVYHTKNELIVVDTQFADNVKPFVSHFDLEKARKIDFLINTHHHGDHTGGNQVLGAFANSMVAHKRVPELLTSLAQAANREAGLIPTTTFDTYWKQDLAKNTIHAYHFGAAHTSGDAVIFFEQEQVAHTGDLVFNRAHPNIDRKAGASIKNWVTYLEKMVETLPKETTYLFGHAGADFPITGSATEVFRFRDYLSAVRAKAEDAFKKGISKEEFTTNPVLQGFEDVKQLGQRLSLSFVLGIAFDEVSEA